MKRRIKETTIFGKSVKLQSLSVSEYISASQSEYETAEMFCVLALVNGDGRTLYAPTESGIEEFRRDFCQDDAAIHNAICQEVQQWVIPEKKNSPLPGSEPSSSPALLGEPT